MGRVSNILNPVSYNANYDLVWSFKFLLSSVSATPADQGGFVTYLVPTTASIQVHTQWVVLVYL